MSSIQERLAIIHANEQEQIDELNNFYKETLAPAYENFLTISSTKNSYFQSFDDYLKIVYHITPPQRMITVFIEWYEYKCEITFFNFSTFGGRYE